MHQANLTPFSDDNCDSRKARAVVRGPTTTLPTSTDGRDVRPRHVIQRLGAFTVFLSTASYGKIAPLM